MGMLNNKTAVVVAIMFLGAAMTGFYNQNQIAGIDVGAMQKAADAAKMYATQAQQAAQAAQAALAEITKLNPVAAAQTAETAMVSYHTGPSVTSKMSAQATPLQVNLTSTSAGGQRVLIFPQNHMKRFYNPKFLNRSMTSANECPWHHRYPRCHFESQLDRENPADAVIVVAGSQSMERPLRTELLKMQGGRRPLVMGVYYSEAHPDKAREHYDFRVASKEDSEVVIYPCSEVLSLMNMTAYGAKQAEESWNRINVTAGFVSNCASRFRNAVVGRLMKHLRIDQYGKCWKNMETPRWAQKIRGSWGNGKMEMLRGYKFSLAMENKGVPNYVSEKIFQSLRAGTIPIFHGAPDITRFVPKGSFIDVRDFPDPESLARHVLEVSQDKEKFFKYFQWGPQDVDKISMELQCNVHWLCRACDEVVKQVRNSTKEMHLV